MRSWSLLFLKLLVGDDQILFLDTNLEEELDHEGQDDEADDSVLAIVEHLGQDPHWLRAIRYRLLQRPPLLVLNSAFDALGLADHERPVHVEDGEAGDKQSDDHAAEQRHEYLAAAYRLVAEADPLVDAGNEATPRQQGQSDDNQEVAYSRTCLSKLRLIFRFIAYQSHESKSE